MSGPTRLMAQVCATAEIDAGPWVVVTVDPETGLITAEGPYGDAVAAAEAASRLQADLDSLDDGQIPMRAVPVLLHEAKTLARSHFNTSDSDLP